MKISSSPPFVVMVSPSHCLVTMPIDRTPNHPTMMDEAESVLKEHGKTVIEYLCCQTSPDNFDCLDLLFLVETKQLSIQLPVHLL